MTGNPAIDRYDFTIVRTAAARRLSRMVQRLLHRTDCFVEATAAEYELHIGDNVQSFPTSAACEAYLLAWSNVRSAMREARR